MGYFNWHEALARIRHSMCHILLLLLAMKWVLSTKIASLFLSLLDGTYRVTGHTKNSSDGNETAIGNMILHLKNGQCKFAVYWNTNELQTHRQTDRNWGKTSTRCEARDGHIDTHWEKRSSLYICVHVCAREEEENIATSTRSYAMY